MSPKHLTSGIKLAMLGAAVTAGMVLQYHGLWLTYITEWMGCLVLLGCLPYMENKSREPRTYLVLGSVIVCIPMLGLANPIVPISLITLGYTAYLQSEQTWSIEQTIKCLCLAILLGGVSWFPSIMNATPWMSFTAPAIVGALSYVSFDIMRHVPDIGHSKKHLPSSFEIVTRIRPQFRQPVYRAIVLCRHAHKQVTDAQTKADLVEIVRWVFTLQHVADQLTTHIQSIDVPSIHSQLALHQQHQSSDELTLERKKGTQKHLCRLLEHREAMLIEVERTHAMVEFANAFLEEANASLYLTLHQSYPCQPSRLPDVLYRLRNHAVGESARRQTQLELAMLQPPT